MSVTCVLSKILYRYDEALDTEEVQSVKISKEEKFLDPHCVPLDAPLMLLNQFNCQHVCFTLCTSVTTVPTASRNAFDVIMQQSKELRLPPEVNGPKIRGDQKV